MATGKKAKTTKERRRFARIEQTETGTQFFRAKPVYPRDVNLEEITLEQIVAFERARWESADGQAHTRLREILNEACVDPLIRQSSEVLTFVSLMRDLFFEAQPGDSVSEFLEPIETLYAGLRSRSGGGGRPDAVTTWTQWSQRYDELKKKLPPLTAQERYEDIAHEWEQQGKAALKWTAIRDGISKLKGHTKNRV